MDDRVGGHYVLQRGQKPPQGNLSTVVKGFDDRDGSSVAIKFVEARDDELSRKLFDRETQALRRLSHRNIVRLRDSGIDESGTYFLVLDWVNRNLNQLLEERPWKSWLEAYRELVRPLLDGLAHAHLKEHEHRDIKPANILIDDEGQPLLADFGIAKLRRDEPRSELTVQDFRSGVYAPPELESSVPFVRDVYSVALVILQCVSAVRIRDVPDIRPALERAEVPPDVRELLGNCLSTDPSERPKDAADLAARLKEVVQRAAAEQGQQRNLVWLDLTRSASEHIAAAVGSGQTPAGFLQNDIGGVMHAEFGIDPDTGTRDRSRLLLYGARLRYSIRVNPARDSRLTVIAAKSVSFEELESGRRRSMVVPPWFGWTTTRPFDLQQSDRGWQLLEEFLDKFYERREQPDPDEAADEDEQFDRWLRILDARAELARGDQPPLQYRSATHDGRRTTLELVEAPESEIVGSDWEIYDPTSGRRFGNGEVIEHEGGRVVLLTWRPLTAIPRQGRIRPYDGPSAIALGRQRTALLAVKGGLTPNPSLKSVLLEPASNANPDEQEISSWKSDLDAAKQRAVKLALGNNEVLLVEGPPGTGKTRFIVETVRQYLVRNPDARILLASQTNVAVDNAVERLHAAGMTKLVRLAAADASSVAPAVRTLLLELQMPRWAEGVRANAREKIEQEAAALDLRVEHAHAALVLEQFVAVSLAYERLSSKLDELTVDHSESSDLQTAVAGQSPIDDLQARLDELDARRRTLSAEATRLVSGDLTIPASASVEEARMAIAAIVGEGPEVQRFLRRLELQAEWMERIESDDGLMATFLSGASVVAGTCIGLLRNRAMLDLEFDLCIVDEASRATLTEALVPMARAKRWILVGDTRQLPPSDENLLSKRALLEEHQLSPEDIQETLFQRFASKLPEDAKWVLDEQYRMVKPIGDLISTCFYEGRLRSTRNDELEGFAAFAGAPVTWLDTSGLGGDRREQGRTSFANRTEVRVLVDKLESLDQAIEYGFVKPPADAPLDVLAIAPYKSQVDDLRRRLQSRSFRHLVVNPMSVDAVQGREADIAVFSVTRSNRDGRLGFLGPEYWRRVNVALSRARYGLMVVGDAGFIRGTSGALKTVLDYIENHPLTCRVSAVPK